MSSIRLIRHATLVLETALGRILVDPMLRAAGTSPPIENTPNPVPNPLVDLPLPAEDVVRDVDLCVVTHLHGDHFDDAAAELLPRDLPILTQPESADALRGRGFTDVRTEQPGLAMIRGRHGTGAIGEAMGAVSGWVVDGIYIAGDTIWCDEVEAALAEHRPRVTIVNAGGARFVGSDPIVMDVADVRRTRQAADGQVVVVHLEAINHCIERRDAYGGIEGITVPADGEALGL